MVTNVLYIERDFYVISCHGVQTLSGLVDFAVAVEDIEEFLYTSKSVISATRSATRS